MFSAHTSDMSLSKIVSIFLPNEVQPLRSRSPLTSNRADRLVNAVQPLR